MGWREGGNPDLIGTSAKGALATQKGCGFRRARGPDLPIFGGFPRARGPDLPIFGGFPRARGPDLPIFGGFRRTRGPDLPIFGGFRSEPAHFLAAFLPRKKRG